MTPKQKLFIKAYLVDLNATRAAIAAGYSVNGADVAGARLLANVRIKAEINKSLTDLCQKLDIKAEEVLGGLKNIAKADVRKLFNSDGTLKPITELDDETALAIGGVEHEKLFDHFGKGQAKQIGNTVKVKLCDRVRALELLGKWNKLKLFTDVTEHVGLEGLAERLNLVRSRKHGRTAN